MATQTAAGDSGITPSETVIRSVLQREMVNNFYGAMLKAPDVFTNPAEKRRDADAKPVDMVMMGDCIPLIGGLKWQEGVHCIRPVRQLEFCLYDGKRRQFPTTLMRKAVEVLGHTEMRLPRASLPPLDEFDSPRAVAEGTVHPEVFYLPDINTAGGRLSIRNQPMRYMLQREFSADEIQEILDPAKRPDVAALLERTYHQPVNLDPEAIADICGKGMRVHVPVVIQRETRSFMPPKYFTHPTETTSSGKPKLLMTERGKLNFRRDDIDNMLAESYAALLTARTGGDGSITDETVHHVLNIIDIMSLRKINGLPDPDPHLIHVLTVLHMGEGPVGTPSLELLKTITNTTDMLTEAYMREVLGVQPNASCRPAVEAYMQKAVQEMRDITGEVFNMHAAHWLSPRETQIASMQGETKAEKARLIDYYIEEQRERFELLESNYSGFTARIQSHFAAGRGADPI